MKNMDAKNSPSPQESAPLELQRNAPQEILLAKRQKKSPRKNAPLPPKSLKKSERTKLPPKLRAAKILRKIFFLIVAAGFIAALGLAILSGLAFSLDQTSPVVLQGNDAILDDNSEHSSWKIAMRYAPGYAMVILVITGICAAILLLWFLAGTAKRLRKFANFLAQKISIAWLADLLVAFAIFVALTLALWLAATPESFLMYVSRAAFVFIVSVLLLLIFSQLTGDDFASISSEDSKNS